MGTTLGRLTNLTPHSLGSTMPSYPRGGHTGDLPTRAGISTHGHRVTVRLWRDQTAAAQGHVWAEDTCTLVCWRPAPCRPGNTRGLSPSGRGHQAPERPTQSYNVIETNVFTAGRSPVTVQWRPRKKASRACQDFRAGPSLAKPSQLGRKHASPGGTFFPCSQDGKEQSWRTQGPGDSGYRGQALGGQRCCSPSLSVQAGHHPRSQGLPHSLMISSALNFLKDGTRLKNPT